MNYCSGCNTSNLFNLSLIYFVLSGVLSTAKKLDRETSAQFSLQITATDGGGKVSNKGFRLHHEIMIIITTNWQITEEIHDHEEMSPQYLSLTHV